MRLKADAPWSMLDSMNCQWQKQELRILMGFGHGDVLASGGVLVDINAPFGEWAFSYL